LNLGIAATEFRIYGRKDQPDFSNEIRVESRGRQQAVCAAVSTEAFSSTLGAETLVAQRQAVSSDIDGIDTEAANRIIRLAERTQAKAGQDVEKIEHIVADHRQIPDPILRQDVPYGGAGGRDHRIGFSLHLDCGRRRGDHQLEILTIIRAGRKRKVVHSLGLKPRERRRYPVRLPGLQTRKVVRPRLIRDRGVADTGLGVNNRNGHPGYQRAALIGDYTSQLRIRALRENRPVNKQA
jgi:hypothetical protein